MSALGLPPQIRSEFFLAADSPYFLGHFRGAPIFPGVAQLECLLQALGEGCGQRLCFVELQHVRFRRALGPGDLVELSAKTNAQGLTTFELRRGTELVTGGCCRLAPCAEQLGREEPNLCHEPPTSGLPQPHELVPQEPPALLLKELIEYGAGFAVAIAGVPRASGFAHAGRYALLAAVEMAAQCAAALEALERRQRGDTEVKRRGLLVGARDIRFLPFETSCQQSLRIRVQLLSRSMPLSNYRFGAGAAATELVQGTFSTYLLDPGVEGPLAP